MIDLVVNNQESIVCFLEYQNVYLSVLTIMASDIQLQLFVNKLGVDSCFYSASSFIHHR